MQTLPPSHRLHEAGGIHVFHRPGVTDWTLVTIGPRQDPVGPEQWWGMRLGSAARVDIIGIASTGYTWFPPAAMAQIVPVVRAAARPRIVLWAFSMGGYAALKYGTALGAAAVMALSPQYSIDPADGTVGPRGLAYFDPAIHAGMRLAPGDYPPGSILMWDPLVQEDHKHARVIARLPGIVPLPLRLAGHATPAVLAETGALVPVAQTLLAGRPAQAIARIRAARRHSPTVLVTAATLLEGRGHARWADAARTRIGAARLNLPRMIESRARGHALLGAPDAELAALRDWVRSSPLDLEPRLRLVATLLARRRPAEAAAAAREAIAAGIVEDRLRGALAEAEAALPARDRPPRA